MCYSVYIFDMTLVYSLVRLISHAFAQKNIDLNQMRLLYAKENVTVTEITVSGIGETILQSLSWLEMVTSLQSFTS